MAGFSQTQPLLNFREKEQIVLHGNFYAASNALTNALTRKLFLGGFIGNTIKDPVSEKLNLKNNRFGFELDYGISYYSNSTSTFGIGGVSWYAGLLNRSIVNASFPRDIFELTFRGNKTFAGSTAGIGSLDLNSYSFQQIQAGILFNNKGGKGTTTVNAGVALLKGQNYLSLDISKGSLFTEENGEYLDINLAMEAAFSDTSHSGISTFNGIGASFHFGLEYLTEKSGGIQLEVSDIGFIRWNDFSHKFSVDSSYRFEGVEVDNIFNSGGLSMNVRDSLPDYLGIESQRTSVLSLLPFKVRFSHQVFIAELKSQLCLGIQQIFFNANYVPLLFAKLNYQPNDYLQITPIISRGGYNNFNAGLALAFSLPKRFFIHLHSDYLLGSLWTKHPSTQGFYVKLTKEFN